MRKVKQNTSVTTGEELGQELLQAVREMNAGQTQVLHSPITGARKASALTQVQFAALMGVSLRTLQDWEQGRRKPSGAAKTLLKIATDHPQILHDLVSA